MTLYAYKCVDCGLEQDFAFKMGEAPAEFVAPGVPLYEPEDHRFKRVYLAVAIYPNGSMGDGYFFHRNKNGTETRGNAGTAGKKRTRWV